MKKRAAKKIPAPAKRVALLVPLAGSDHTRVAKMADKSELTIECWSTLAVMHACAVDERHWKELEERDALRGEIDRGQFGRLAVALRNLPPRAIDALVDALVMARLRGRREGSESARGLATLRRVVAR